MTTNKVEGFIKGINGQIAEVEIISENEPNMLEILQCVEEKDARGSGAQCAYACA